MDAAASRIEAQHKHYENTDQLWAMAACMDQEGEQHVSPPGSLANAESTIGTRITMMAGPVTRQDAGQLPGPVSFQVNFIGLSSLVARIVKGSREIVLASASPKCRRYELPPFLGSDVINQPVLGLPTTPSQKSNGRSYSNMGRDVNCSARGITTSGT